MRPSFVTALLMLVHIVPSVAAADSKTFECDAAKERATVGVYEVTEVSITADRDKRQCFFSVNGATVGSPPPDQIIVGLRAIARREMSGLLEKEDIAPLAYALLAAAPVREIPEKLLQILKNSIKQLVECFQAYENEKTKFRTATDNLVCQIVPRTESARVLAEGLVRVTNSRPELQFAVRNDGFEHYLFVSLSLPREWFD